MRTSSALLHLVHVCQHPSQRLFGRPVDLHLSVPSVFQTGNTFTEKMVALQQLRPADVLSYLTLANVLYAASALYLAATLKEIVQRLGHKRPPKTHPLADLPLPIIGGVFNFIATLQTMKKVCSKTLQWLACTYVADLLIHTCFTSPIISDGPSRSLGPCGTYENASHAVVNDTLFQTHRPVL